LVADNRQEIDLPPAWEDLQMNLRNKVLTVSLSLLVGLAGVAVARAQQDTESPKQDMKDAGHATKNAAKDTGRATKKTAKNTGHAAKRTTNKAARKTEHGAQKVEDKTKPSPNQP
jgi:hypothetical protein